MERTNWTIEFSWVKAHVGIYGNGLADQLAKAAACNRDTTVSFKRIPKNTLYSEIEEAAQKWQKLWKNCMETAITKPFFPNIQDRLNFKINVTPNFTVMVTGHWKTSPYLHRFKIMEHATCHCNEGVQTIDTFT